MKLEADGVAVVGAHAPLLPATSVTACVGEVTLVAADPGHGSVALALVLGGRLTPTSGTIRLGGVDDPEALRLRVALVDVPTITEPEGVIGVRAVIAEELALSGQRARGRDVADFLQTLDDRRRGRLRWEQLPPSVRTQWLAELASRRADVDFLVLASPDRFGGDPRDWWDVAKAVAGKGIGVIVQCTHASARLLGEPVHYQLGVVH